MGARAGIVIAALAMAAAAALWPAAARAASGQGAPAAGCPARFSLVSTPHPTGGTGNINGIGLVPSSEQAWAVGAQDQNNLTLPIVDRFRNGAWHAVASPQPFQFTRLNAVSASSATDAWAVGGDSGGTHTLIEHWNGRSWSVAPAPDIDGQLFGVAALSATDAWAVGEDFTTSGPLVEHWNGHTWSTVPAFDPFPSVEVLITDVARVPGAARAWAVGPFVSYQLAHGTATFRQMPGFADVGSVTVPAARDVWAVGGSGTGGITEHFDGSAWHKFFTKGVYLAQVAAVSPGDVWATWSPQLAGTPRFAHLVGGRWHLLGGVPGFGRALAFRLRPDGSGWAGGASPSGQPQLVRACGL
jgi:hypothetical protein